MYFDIDSIACYNNKNSAKKSWLRRSLHVEGSVANTQALLRIFGGLVVTCVIFWQYYIRHS
jgi:hypothetical protein